MDLSLTTNETTISISAGDVLDVRSLRVAEGVSMLFRIELEVVSHNQDIDFSAVVGQPARVALNRLGHTRAWEGVVDDIAQLRVEPSGLSTYALSVVPTLWLATQGQNYRVFQNQSELDVVTSLLGERNIRFLRRTLHPYKRRSFIIQYGESDFAFISRMLESIGVSYAFAFSDDSFVVVLADALEAIAPTIESLPFFDTPPEHAKRWVNHLTVRQRVRPGRHRVQDLDYRRPSNAQPALEASHGLPQEQALEVMEWSPGAFLFETEIVGETPAADDRGVARTDTAAGRSLVSNRLLSARSAARVISFATPAIDLVPGHCLTITGHPSREAEGRSLLVIRNLIGGGPGRPWISKVECAATDQPYRPPMVTPKPRVTGVESAVVVGPVGEQIHTDEFGRVRVQFHWDREGARNERSSCWVPVNQPWGGAGFGAINLPRVGQEVLLEFVGGDPDRPVILGRVFTTTQPPPYKLPGFKKVSGIRSATSPNAGSEVASLALGLVGSLLGGKGKPLDASALHEQLHHPFFKAQSPDTSTHKWSGNELSFCDEPNGEQLYLQAEKDMNVVVKNAKTAVIGNHRAEQVGTDDILVVGNRQSIEVADNQSTLVFGDRSVAVMGAESHTTHGEHAFTCHANSHLAVDLKWDSKAKIQEHTAEDLMVLKVGSSRIVLRPEFIIIQSTDVFINPGDADTDAAINDGTRPKPESEKQAEAAAAEAAEEQRQLDRRRAAFDRQTETPGATPVSADPVVNEVVNDMVLQGYDRDPQFLAQSPAETGDYLRHNYQPGQISSDVPLTGDQIDEITTILGANN